VTATYDGTIWATRSDGQLLWYRRHAVYSRGGDYWLNPGVGKVVGGGGWYGGTCGFQTVLSGGWGVIYAVDSAGRLRHFADRGYRDGMESWDAGPVCGLPIGTGWM
jgi:hypothetical protein